MTKEEILRKRNLELTKEISELKRQLAEQQQMEEQAKKIVKANEEIRVDLMSALQQAYEFRDKYQELVKEVKNFKKTVKGRNAIERWVFDLKKK